MHAVIVLNQYVKVEDVAGQMVNGADHIMLLHIVRKIAEIIKISIQIIK
jgi:hypothetical protein